MRQPRLALVVPAHPVPALLLAFQAQPRAGITVPRRMGTTGLPGMTAPTVRGHPVPLPEVNPRAGLSAVPSPRGAGTRTGDTRVPILSP